MHALDLSLLPEGTRITHRTHPSIVFLVTSSEEGFTTIVRSIIIANTRPWTRQGAPIPLISDLRKGDVLFRVQTQEEVVVTSLHTHYAIATQTKEILPKDAIDWNFAS